MQNKTLRYKCTLNHQTPFMCVLVYIVNFTFRSIPQKHSKHSIVHHTSPKSRILSSPILSSHPSSDLYTSSSSSPLINKDFNLQLTDIDDVIQPYSLSDWVILKVFYFIQHILFQSVIYLYIHIIIITVYIYNYLEKFYYLKFLTGSTGVILYCRQSSSIISFMLYRANSCNERNHTYVGFRTASSQSPPHLERKGWLHIFHVIQTN